MSTFGVSKGQVRHFLGLLVLGSFFYSTSATFLLYKSYQGIMR
ncbi:hypothetical protein M23134_06979 [Microscilla marina ATCC 23134]|uniref:Uncharacterized protein n=1 Tax=Microscilla marina ATCC 23134 TaxID=313606 RepID=A1ZYJ2_MICM2|nr:hypothetical protein M23134_06979 [Microscilla marina ATCC 23134]